MLFQYGSNTSSKPGEWERRLVSQTGATKSDSAKGALLKAYFVYLANNELKLCMRVIYQLEYENSL